MVIAYMFIQYNYIHQIIHTWLLSYVRGKIILIIIFLPTTVPIHLSPQESTWKHTKNGNIIHLNNPLPFIQDYVILIMAIKALFKIHPLLTRHNITKQSPPDPERASDRGS